MPYEQLDVYDVLDLIHADEERDGMQRDTVLKPCADCADPALCQAESYCVRGEA